MGWEELTKKQESFAQPNWVTEKNFETIVVYGKPKVGKTQAYMSLIGEESKKDPEKKFFLICTDNGASRTFKSYFGGDEKILEKIKYYSVANPDQAFNAVQEIRATAKSKDWCIIDLASDVWEFAQDAFQDEMAKMFGGSVTGMFVQASKDPKLFGAFSGQQWQWVKRLDNMVCRDFVANPICNVLAVCAEKDISMEEALEENAIKKGKLDKKSEELSLFEKIGARPAGQKQLSYLFNSVVYVSGVNQKFYTIVGDRGQLAVGQAKPFGTNFWKTFLENERGVKA